MNSQLASCSSLKYLILLAPAASTLHRRFDNVWRSNATYTRMLADMQRLRGNVYLKEGAIEDSELTPDGRHQTASDEHSWHLLTVNSAGQVLGCLRYFRPNLTCLHALNVRRAALPRARSWCPHLHQSIQTQLIAARRARFSYVELGGWALTEELRNTTEALRGVLATYAWSQHIGGALGLSTATERNSSRLILRRLGGKPLDTENGDSVPYYDQQYRCNMELLRFDSREPNPKYRDSIETMRSRFSQVPVVCPASTLPWGRLAASVRKFAAAPLWTEELLAGFI